MLIKSGKNKNVNPKINIVKLDKNSIPLTVIILPIYKVFFTTQFQSFYFILLIMYIYWPKKT